jgi:hypothetical protein
MQARQYRGAKPSATGAAAGPEYAQQAQEQREQQAEQATRRAAPRIVENFRNMPIPRPGPKLQQELSAVARELGYPPELIGQRAQPTSSPCGSGEE